MEKIVIFMATRLEEFKTVRRVALNRISCKIAR